LSEIRKTNTGDEMWSFQYNPEINYKFAMETANIPAKQVSLHV
jgi:hypothetical protein